NLAQQLFRRHFFIDGNRAESGIPSAAARRCRAAAGQQSRQDGANENGGQRQGAHHFSIAAEALMATPEFNSAARAEAAPLFVLAPPRRLWLNDTQHFEAS